MPDGRKQKTYKTSSQNGNITDVLKELWQAAVNLRGSIEPSDYKRYVLPIIFLRFLSLRYERRWEDVKHKIADPQINDQILAGMPDGMVVVNATGMGKDTPASPVTDAGVFPCPGCWGAANLTLTTRKRNTVHLSTGFSKMSANLYPRGANFPSG